jgi:isoleucyl-tRNA synthetase
LTIALDNTLTPELVREGNAREFVNRIQNLRKDSGFDVTDKINIQVQRSDDEWTASLNEFKGYISQEVQALSLEWVDSASTEITFDESNLFVNVTVA